MLSGKVSGVTAAIQKLKLRRELMGAKDIVFNCCVAVYSSSTMNLLTFFFFFFQSARLAIFAALSTQCRFSIPNATCINVGYSNRCFKSDESQVR